MFSKLGLQVYTVRDHIKDEQSMDATFAKLAEIGYSELQTAGWESETYAALAKKHGLTVVGTHYNYDKIINNIDETVALHKALGTTNIGVGGCSARSYDEIMAFIEKYNAEKGCKVHYIDSNGWISPEPLHPYRDGHRTVAEHLTEKMKEIINK